MPAVTQVDPEKVLVDYLFALLPSIPEAAGYSVGTKVAPNTTPVKAVRVRLVGGVTEARVAARPRLDVRLWGDGSAAGEGAVKKLARILHGRIQRDFRCTTFASPVPLPDPADQSRGLVLFTVELLLKGVQS